MKPELWIGRHLILLVNTSETWRATITRTCTVEPPCKHDKGNLYITRIKSICSSRSYYSAVLQYRWSSKATCLKTNVTVLWTQVSFCANKNSAAILQNALEKIFVTVDQTFSSWLTNKLGQLNLVMLEIKPMVLTYMYLWSVQLWPSCTIPSHLSLHKCPRECQHNTQWILVRLSHGAHGLFGDPGNMRRRL